MTATLAAENVPGDDLGAVVPEIFRLSDESLGTDFGVLLPPF